MSEIKYDWTISKTRARLSRGRFQSLQVILYAFLSILYDDDNEKKLHLDDNNCNYYKNK